MKSSNRGHDVGRVIVGVLCLAAVSCVQAIPIILNGGFESGFLGWTRNDQLGSEGSFALQSGTTSPVSGTTVPAPPEGTLAAMTDANGPGTHVMYQDFLVPVGGATLSFALFVGNRDTDFFVAPASVGLDFSTPALNQQARVDIIRSAADPFSVAASDVLLNLFQTSPGSPLVSGYSVLTRDVSAFLAAHTGETLRLRFAEVDNVAPFQLGVDNVRFAAIPEPTSILLLSLALVSLFTARSARKRLARR